MTEISFGADEPRPLPGHDHHGALTAERPTLPALLPPPQDPSTSADLSTGAGTGKGTGEPPSGGRGHTRDCPATDTDDVLRQCARPGCGRAKPDREPRKGGRPSKYCCKLCANEASRAADSAPAALATHTAVSAFAAEAGQIRARLHQRDAHLAAEREDLRLLDERLQQVGHAVDTQLTQAENAVQQAESDTEQARTSMREAHAARQAAEQERDVAHAGQQEALSAQRAAEEHRDRIHGEARANAERLGMQIGQLTAQLHDEQALTRRQAERLGVLDAQVSRAGELAEQRAAALAERDTQLHKVRADLRRLSEQLEQTSAHLATTRQHLDQATSSAEQARAETRAVREDLVERQHRFEEERDRLREQRDTARLTQATAETRLEMAERELQTLRRQLAAAQAATGLVVPPLADVDGRPGVRLPGGTFHAVTLQDGVVLLHHGDDATPLGDASQSPARARGLSAALQAVTIPAADLSG